MNLTMSPPVSYPFYMDSPRLPYANIPWSANPYSYSPPMQPHFHSNYSSAGSATSPLSYQVPFVLRQPPRPYHAPGKYLQSMPSYTNMRYNHLKQSTSHVHRHRSMDVSFYGQQMLIPPASPLPPSHQQHYHHHHPHPHRPSKTKSVSDFHQLSNFPPTHLAKAHSWHSMGPLNPLHAPRLYPMANPPHSLPSYEQRSTKFIHRRQLSSSASNENLSRLSTFDQMPIISNPIYQRSQSSSSRNSIGLNKDSSSPSRSSSSSADSLGSRQKRLNGSLCRDPLILAAMEDFQQLQRTSSRSTSLTAQRRELSRDSLCSESSSHSSLSSAHSQSSFTSLERLEIRHLIKALKNKTISPSALPVTVIKSTPTAEPTSVKSAPRQSMVKPQKSSITEELEKKFARIRSSRPNEEITYVKPSLLNQQKITLEKLRIESAEIPLKKENVVFPSPPPEIHVEIKEEKPEYAIPMKTTSNIPLRLSKKKMSSEQIRSFSFCKPMSDLVDESRPISMLNWFQYGLTNPLPSTFQSNAYSKTSDDYSHSKALVKENIYASEIDVHVPHTDEKDYLHQIDFNNDYFTSSKTATKHSSILPQFSRLFSRVAHHEHEEKSKRKCKFSQHKNHHLRCSIM